MARTDKTAYQVPAVLNRSVLPSDGASGLATRQIPRGGSKRAARGGGPYSGSYFCASIWPLAVSM